MAPRRRARSTRRPPPLPETGGVFEAFTIELVNPDVRSVVRRAITPRLGAGWRMQAFGDSGVDFELTNRSARLTAAEAWEATYALRAVPGVVYAEPLFAVSVSDNPRWLTSAGPAPSPTALGEETAESFLSGAGGKHLPQSDAPEWSLTATQVQIAWERFFPSSERPPGADVVIGHPDTGYQDHPEITGQLLTKLGYDFVHEDHDAHDDLEQPPGELIPNPGHGTGTASVIVSPTGPQASYASGKWVSGVAPGARIIPLRTAYSVVLLSTLNLARAIEYAADHGAHVI